MHYDVTLHDITAIINHCIQHIVILYQAPRGFIYFKLVPGVQIVECGAKSKCERKKSQGGGYDNNDNNNNDNNNNNNNNNNNKPFIKSPFPRVQMRYLQLKFKNYNQSLNLKTTQLKPQAKDKINLDKKLALIQRYNCKYLDGVLEVVPRFLL